MLFVPEPAEGTVGIRKLVEHFLKMAAAGCQRAVAPGMKESAQAVHGNRAQPAAEGAGSKVVTKVWQLANEDGKNFLNQVLGIGPLQQVAVKPATDERRIEIDQQPPRCGIRAKP